MNAPFRAYVNMVLKFYKFEQFSNSKLHVEKIIFKYFFGSLLALEEEQFLEKKREIKEGAIKKSANIYIIVLKQFKNE